MIQWFKTMTTNEYISGVKKSRWPAFDGKLWQRNYYEHIIRDEKSLEKTREYIVGNPLNWDDDDYFVETIGVIPLLEQERVRGVRGWEG